MKTGDYGRAAVVALLLVIANFAVGFVAVLVYSLAIEPGHDPAFYQRAAQSVVPWTVGFVAPLLFALAGYWSARRRPERNALRFAGAFWLAYVLIDALAGVGMGQPTAILSLAMGIPLIADLAGALAGAWLGSRRRAAPGQA